MATLGAQPQENNYMDNKKLTQFGLIKISWLSFFDLLLSKIRIIMPFGVLAAIEAISILGIFICLQPPLVSFFEPVVLRFWGDKFLHYPYSLFLVFKIFRYLSILTSIFLSTFAAGMTITLAYLYIKGKNFDIKRAFKITMSRYVHLLFISLIIFGLVYALNVLEKTLIIKLVTSGIGSLRINADGWFTLSVIVSVLTGSVLQAFFIFTFPIALIEGKNFVISIFKGLMLSFKNIFSSLIIVLLPMLFYLPIALLRVKMFDIMQKTFPEIVFFVLLAGILVTTGINLFISICSVKLYMLICNTEKK